jgi:hypothetical protein
VFDRTIGNTSHNDFELPFLNLLHIVDRQVTFQLEEVNGFMIRNAELSRSSQKDRELAGHNKLKPTVDLNGFIERANPGDSRGTINRVFRQRLSQCVHYKNNK